MNASVIAIDCDSVLFPINELVVLPLLSERLGREVVKQEITSWDYGEIEGGKAIAYEAFQRPNLYDPYDLSIVGDAEAGLWNLRHTYDRVIAVSAPFDQHAGSKWRFLRRCGFAHEDIFLAADKGMVFWDVLVDDAPKYALEFGNEEVVVFDQPWNRDLTGFERAYGWADVPRKVARLTA